MAIPAYVRRFKPASPRELEIERLLDAGKSRREIMAITDLSDKSVDYYLGKIRARRGILPQRTSPTRPARPRRKETETLADMRCRPVGLDPLAVAAAPPVRPSITEADLTDSKTSPMLVVNIETGGIRLDRRKEVCPWLASDE